MAQKEWNWLFSSSWILAFSQYILVTKSGEESEGESNPNTVIFSNAISSFQLTSQHPYAEVYIGKPHVWTVDINNLSEVEKAVKSILNQKVRNVFSILNQHLRIYHGTWVDCLIMLI